MQETTRMGRVRLPATDLWRFGAFFLLPALALAAIAVEAAEHEPFHFDRHLVPGIGPLGFEPLKVLFAFMAVVGGGIGLTAVSALPVAHFVLRRRYTAAAFIPAALLGAWLINRIIKMIVARPRPEETMSPLPQHWRLILAGVIVAAVAAAWPTRWRGFSLIALGAFAVMWTGDVIVTRVTPVAHHLDSFPSGHAVGSMALASSLVLLTWRSKWRWLTLMGGGMFVVIVGVSRIYFGLHYASDIVGGWLLALAWTVLLAALFRSRLLREEPSRV